MTAKVLALFVDYGHYEHFLLFPEIGNSLTIEPIFLPRDKYVLQVFLYFFLYFFLKSQVLEDVCFFG